MTTSAKFIAAMLLVAAAPWVATPVTASPLSSPQGLQNAGAPLVETVQYRRGWRGGGPGFGVGAGFAAGAIISGIIAASRPYPYDYYVYGGYERGYSYGPEYAYGPGYDQQEYVVGYPGGQNEVAYCQQRFRSYDPASGSYLGFDGLRHSCP